MTAKDLINYTIPPLKLTDDVEKALIWMQEFHVHELPVIDDGKFLGLFNENLLFDIVEDTKVVGDIQLVSTHLAVHQDEHYYEVLKKAYEASSTLVAVLNNEDTYIGAVTIQDVVEAFSKMSSIHSPGTILVLTLSAHDYSMTEIGKIVESEGSKILSSFTENIDNEPDKIRLTLKLNTNNVNSVVSSFERYGHSITSIFGQEDESNIEKERLDTLMKYLSV
ncbi:MAG: cbs domain containing protein [Reichenbachiella sp.]